MKECAITQDLLPLYIEGLTGPETEEFVREHLSNCERCRKMHDRMTAPEELKVSAVDYKKTMRKSVVKIAGASLLALAVVALFVVYLFWEYGAFGLQTVYSPDGQRFVDVYDNTGAGFFDRGGVFVSEPNHVHRDCRGDDSFEKFTVQWAPDSDHYFACWEFDDHEEAYFVTFQENPEGGTDTRVQYPENSDLYGALDEMLRQHPGMENERVEALFGVEWKAEWESAEFNFLRWEEEDMSAWFYFSTDRGENGYLRFDLDNREIAELVVVETRCRVTS